MDGIGHEAHLLRCDIREGVNMTYAFGVDISKYQSSQNGKILQDFDALANHSEKVSFIFARAGVSWGYKDPCFDYYWSEMARIGVCRGAYHYLYPSQSVQRQMDWFLSIAHNRTEHDRLALDLETTNGLYRQQVTDFLNNCLEYLKERTGRYPILYSRKSWLDPYVDMRQVPEVDLWIARYASIPPGKIYAPEYPTPPELPNHTHNWLIHQVGDKMPPIGCQSKTMDYDRWNGDEAAVRAYFGFTEEQPPAPEPEPEPMPAYRARVTATAGLNVRAGAGYSYPISAPGLVFGTIVEVYENKDGWSRHNKGGWSNAAWLERIGEAPQPPQPPVITEQYYGPLYWQKDPRWVNVRLGTGTSTIGGYGCVITSEANVLNQLGITTNPFANNEWRTTHGGYVESNKIIWEKVQEQHPEIVWDGRMYNPTDAQMIAKVQAGCGLVILVDHIEASAPLNEHWVCSVNRGDGQLWIYDPWDGQLVRYRDRYKKPTLQCTVYRRAS